MTPRMSRERDEISHQLGSIIRDLEDVAHQLQSAKGIGMEYIATKLMRLREKYMRIRSLLP